MESGRKGKGRAVGRQVDFIRAWTNYRRGKLRLTDGTPDGRLCAVCLLACEGKSPLQTLPCPGPEPGPGVGVGVCVILAALPAHHRRE